MPRDKQLRRYWRTAGEELCFEVVEDLRLKLTPVKQLMIPILVPRFGASNGMLIVTELDQLGDAEEELVNRGYGYSVMEEPRDGEDYDREVFVDILTDWGWTGKASNLPIWLKAGA